MRAHLSSIRPSGEIPRSFTDFQRQVDGMFQNLLSSDALAARGAGDFQPPMNVVETDDAYEISVEVPGVKPENLDVEVEHGFLKVSGEKAEERKHETAAWRRVERTYGSFQRVVKLGAAVDAERITAESRDGVLYIRAPKAELAKARKIQIANTCRPTVEGETAKTETGENGNG